MLVDPAHFPQGNAHFHIQGPSGLLEVKSTLPAGGSRYAALLCHPHPQYQGTMDNKVVQTMARAFEGLGAAVVRFNYRGVGSSAGEYAHGVGELADCQAVLQWLRHTLAPSTCWIGGFSFGSWIACQAAIAAPTEIQRLLMVAPPVQYIDFDRLHPQQRGTVILAEHDEIVPAEAIRQWVHSRQRAEPLSLHTFTDSSHFFHGQLATLRECIQQDFSLS